MSSHGHITYTPVIHDRDEADRVSDVSALSARATHDERTARRGNVYDMSYGQDDPRQEGAWSNEITPATSKSAGMYSQRTSDFEDGPARHQSHVAPGLDNKSHKRSHFSFFGHVSKRPRRFDSHAWWWWELGAALLSITCMCLLVAVLLILKDKPLEDWSRRHSISPNTTISLLTTIAKASIITVVAACLSQLKWSYFEQPRRLRDLQGFDDASRGPVGSLTFLVTIGVRGRAVLATLGALVTIIALAFEPFAQQILAYPVRMTVSKNDTAMITRATGWQSNDFAARNYTAFDNPDAMAGQNKIMVGITGSTGNATTSCTTSRCEFGDLASLAVCGECRDISHAVQQNCTTRRLDGFGFEYVCSYTPEGQGLPSVTDLTMGMEATYDGAPNVLGDVPFGVSSTVQNSVASADSSFNITTVYTTDRSNWTGQKTGFSDSKVIVNACGLSFCLKNFTDMSIVNGALQHSVETTLLYANDSGSVDTKIITLSTDPRPGADPQYSLDVTTLSNVWSLLAGQFQGKQSPDPSVSDITQVAVHYLAAHNVSDVVDSVAQTLTNMIMSSDNVFTTQQAGVPMTSKVFVHVRWPWLILPMCLEVAALILLTTLLISNARRPGTALLKSSALALLFSEMRGWRPEEVWVEGNADLRSYSNTAKGLKAVIGTREGGLRTFVKAE